MAEYVDFFNFMSYDLHGAWEIDTLGPEVRSQSSILDIENDITPLWFDGVPPSKINLGIPYYGRGYTLQNSSCSDLRCPYTGPSDPGNCTNTAGVLSLREIEVIIKQRNLVPKLLEEEMVKQISWDDQWMGYDDADTVKLKSSWADQYCLGGMMFWSVDFSRRGT